MISYQHLFLNSRLRSFQSCSSYISYLFRTRIFVQDQTHMLELGDHKINHLLN